MRDQDQLDEWLDPKAWPVPDWFLNASVQDSVRNFQSLSAHHLRARYIELEGDFRSIAGNYPPADMATAAAIFRYLHLVRESLAKRSPQLLACASTLDLIERYMVWIYPPHVLAARISSAIVRLETLQPRGWEEYIVHLRSDTAPRLRMPLDEAIGACNRLVLDRSISTNLQIRRLRTYRNWSIFVLIVLLGISPFLARNLVEYWPQPPPALYDVAPWIPTISVLLMGLLGGFMSGLLKVRASEVTLTDYQEGMVKLSMRPLLGGMAALILYILISWDLIPGIKADKAGSYMFIAFLSGFSERYFLRLIEEQAAERIPEAPPRQAMPSTGVHVEPAQLPSGDDESHGPTAAT